MKVDGDGDLLSRMIESRSDQIHVCCDQGDLDHTEGPSPSSLSSCSVSTFTPLSHRNQLREETTVLCGLFKLLGCIHTL